MSYNPVTRVPWATPARCRARLVIPLMDTTSTRAAPRSCPRSPATRSTAHRSLSPSTRITAWVTGTTVARPVDRCPVTIDSLGAWILPYARSATARSLSYIHRDGTTSGDRYPWARADDDASPPGARPRGGPAGPV